MTTITLNVRARVRIRQGTPSTAAVIADRMDPGASLQAVAKVTGESVHGNAAWYELDGSRYIWSGAVDPIPDMVPPAPGGGPPVQTYPDGNIRVLSDAQIKAIYGEFRFSETFPPGAVDIDPQWVADNIVEIATPILASVHYPKISVHRLAAKSFTQAFERIRNAGLADRILTCGGTWVPRHKSWDVRRTLSSHSWGIAIDLNVHWNGYGSMPAAFGAIGSVRELIPHFAAEGFGWGGNFSGSPDGMHFELSLTTISE